MIKVWGAGVYQKDLSWAQGGGEGVQGGSKTDHIINEWPLSNNLPSCISAPVDKMIIAAIRPLSQ